MKPRESESLVGRGREIKGGGPGCFLFGPTKIFFPQYGEKTEGGGVGGGGAQCIEVTKMLMCTCTWVSSFLCPCALSFLVLLNSGFCVCVCALIFLCLVLFKKK